jgi:cytochrome c-type biogenesis protein CcmF
VQVLLTFILGAFTLTTVVVEFQKGTRARAAIEGEGYAKGVRLAGAEEPPALRRLHRARGLVLMFMGFAGAAYDVEKQVTLTPGESAVVRSPFGHEYRLTYQDMSWYTATNMTKIALDAGGAERAARGRPHRRAPLVPAAQETATEVGIRRAWNEDLYLILAGIDDAEGFRARHESAPVGDLPHPVNPLVPWIWVGGFIMALGTLIAMWPAAAARWRRNRERCRHRARGRAGEREVVGV